jgi:hypothetical protein
MEEAATATMEQAAALVKQLSGRYSVEAPQTKELKSNAYRQLEASAALTEAEAYAAAVETVDAVEMTP